MVAVLILLLGRLKTQVLILLLELAVLQAKTLQLVLVAALQILPVIIPARGTPVPAEQAKALILAIALTVVKVAVRAREQVTTLVREQVQVQTLELLVLRLREVDQLPRTHRPADKAPQITLVVEVVQARLIVRELTIHLGVVLVILLHK